MGKAIARLSFAAGLMLILAGGVQAGEEMHHHGRHMDKEMERQHRLMGSYAIAQAKITAALERRDAATVEAETRKLLATISDLKRAKPHKNLKQQKAFVKIASAFEADVEKTNALGKKGDLPGAKAAFARRKSGATNAMPNSGTETPDSRMLELEVKP